MQITARAQIHIKLGTGASLKRFAAYLGHYETQEPFWHLLSAAAENQPRFACSSTPIHSKMNQSCTEI
jgi:hypothetical protein